MKQIFILIGVILAVIVIILFARRFGSGESVRSERPRVICNDQCFWTAHLHANLKVFNEGNPVSMGFEQGNLQGVHTHTQSDKIHWHGFLPVDRLTQKITDSSPLALVVILRDLGITIDKPTAVVKFFVNGQETEDLTSIWQDGDNIEIHYD